MSTKVWLALISTVSRGCCRASVARMGISAVSSTLRGAVIRNSPVTAPPSAQSGQHHRIVFGELDGRITPRGAAKDVYQAAGIGAELTGDIRRIRWERHRSSALASSGGRERRSQRATRLLPLARRVSRRPSGLAACLPTT
jgi:hypothetical protein